MRNKVNITSTLCIGGVNVQEDMIVWNKTLCSASNDKTIILYTPPVWSVSTHSSFPVSSRQQVVTLLMIAAKKQDGTPYHPESHFHTLPKEILFLVLSYSIQFW
jgi:hypothetical protein